jgi:hypothetical protein
MLQLLVVNNLELTTYINPFIYIIFILSLPVNMKPWIVLTISFFTGMVMDSFYSTPGLHMGATIFMGYLRGFYLRIAANKEDFESRISPSVADKGIVWFLVYALSLTIAHHLFLFFFEVYSFFEFFRTLLRISGSALFSVLLIVIGELLFFSKSKIR